MNRFAIDEEAAFEIQDVVILPLSRRFAGTLSELEKIQKEMHRRDSKLVLYRSHCYWLTLAQPLPYWLKALSNQDHFENPL